MLTFISQLSTQTMHIMQIIRKTTAIFSSKNPKPSRDLNPGLLFLWQVRCPLRHSARA
jgi:hypothetical protein